MATFNIPFDMPSSDKNSENVGRVKELLITALEHFKSAEGDSLSTRDYALAKLILDGTYLEMDDPRLVKMIAEEAEVA